MAKTLPPWIYCPRCGRRVELTEDTSAETAAKLKEQGYEALARGICECGVVAVLCYQPLPASPTFSLFFDIYQPEAVKAYLEGKKV